MIRIRKMSKRHFKHICKVLDENDQLQKEELEALRKEIIRIKYAYVKKHGDPHSVSTKVKGIAPDIEASDDA